MKEQCPNCKTGKIKHYTKALDHYRCSNPDCTYYYGTTNLGAIKTGVSKE